MMQQELSAKCRISHLRWLGNDKLGNLGQAILSTEASALWLVWLSHPRPFLDFPNVSKSGVRLSRCLENRDTEGPTVRLECMRPGQFMRKHAGLFGTTEQRGNRGSHARMAAFLPLPTTKYSLSDPPSIVAPLY